MRFLPRSSLYEKQGESDQLKRYQYNLDYDDGMVS